MSYGGRQLSHYHLLPLMGSNNGEEIYLAEDMRIQRQVVITVVRNGATSLLPTEIRAIAMLDHPHILPVFDFGTESIDETFFAYLVMPFCPEGSLADWLQQHDTSEKLSLEDIEHILEQAAEALQYAHDRRLIHQNVKPGNLLIRRRKEHPSHPDLLLTGFRIGSSVSTTLSITESVQGTPAYRAPEQWESQFVPATDQYALAALIYQLLVGHPPFEGMLEEAKDQHLNQEPQPPSIFNTHLPHALNEVILRALAKRPEDRFPSISAFAMAFKQGLSTNPHEIATEKSKEITQPITSPDNTEPIRHIDGSFPSPGVPPPPPPIFTPSVPPVNNKKQGLRGKWLFLALGLLILFLIGSTGLFTGLLSSNMFNQNVLGNAAHHSSTVDKDVRATLTAQTNATATVVSASYPFSNKLLVNDPLNNNNLGYSWGLGSDDVGNCAFQEGTYHVSVVKQNRFHPCIAKKTDFSNFTFEVQMTIIKGDCGGIIFRRNGSQFYYFRICANGSYTFYRYRSDFNTSQNAVLADSNNPAIYTGLDVTNTVAVVARGSKLDLYINRHLISNIIDTSYIEGQIGLVAKENNQPTEVVFANVRIWAL